MRDNSLIRDIGIAVLFVAAIVATYYLVVAGLMSLMMIGFIMPGWLILLVLVLVIMKKKNK